MSTKGTDKLRKQILYTKQVADDRYLQRVESVLNSLSDKVDRALQLLKSNDKKQ